MQLIVYVKCLRINITQLRRRLTKTISVYESNKYLFIKTIRCNKKPVNLNKIIQTTLRHKIRIKQILSDEFINVCITVLTWLRCQFVYRRLQDEVSTQAGIQVWRHVFQITEDVFCRSEIRTAALCKHIYVG